MTRLLVSVRNVAEAMCAWEAGAALIDVKEPLRGSLGAADAGEIATVVEAVAGRVPVSAALGELVDWPTQGVELPGQLSFAKLGLAGCSSSTDWLDRWSAALKSLPAGTKPVAVVYADWRTAQAPRPKDVLQAARQLGCAAALVDTYDKTQGGLLDHWPLADLTDFVAAARDAGLLVVLAGSLTLTTIPRVLPVAPDYIAVRGAACRGPRSAEIHGELVRGLVALVNSLDCTALGTPLESPAIGRR